MESTQRPRLKVCCIMSREEAAVAIRAGADALGLVSAMPSGPGVIEDARIAAIARAVPPPVATFLLTSAQSVAGIIQHHRRVLTTTVQIVDRIIDGDHARLRAGLPGVTLVQVIHVTGPASFEEACAIAPHVDAVLLDSGRPAAAVKELGGTGRTHDWSISRRIREALPVPVFLAGGLTPENVCEAIREVGPFGIDLCSGVRTGGRLDPAKLQALVRAMPGR